MITTILDLVQVRFRRGGKIRRVQFYPAASRGPPSTSWISYPRSHFPRMLCPVELGKTLQGSVTEVFAVGGMIVTNELEVLGDMPRRNFERMLVLKVRST